MKKCFLFCFFILLTINHFFLFAADDPTIGWQKFESSDQKYGIKIPPTWVVHFKNDMGDYIFHSTKDPKDGNNLAVEVTCKSVDKKLTLENFFIESKGAATSRYKDFLYVDSREDQVNSIKTKWFTFSFTENDMKKQGNQYCIVYNGKAYNITFSGNIGVFNDQTEFLTNILNTFDTASYQPCATVTMSPPEKWFSGKEAGYLYVFTAKDNGGKSPSDGIIKVKQTKLEKIYMVNEYMMKIRDDIAKERPKAALGEIATTKLDGQVFNYFDVSEKDGLFFERHFISVYQRCGFEIINICAQPKFETEFKMIFASSLKTYKIEK